MTDFHFIRPFWLLALIPLLLSMVLLQKQKKHPGAWANVIDPQLIKHLLSEQVHASHHWLLVIYGLAGFLSILAMAGPSWERLPAPVFRNQDALVIVFDLSRSMESEDLKPNRLERARYKVDDLLNQRKDGQTALVVFAGEAFTVTPLTDDRETIRHQLAALSTSLMPVQGSRADTGINLALELLKQADAPAGQVLLITDGTDLNAALESIEELTTAGHRLSVLSVGTPNGAPIKLKNGGFLKDARGNIVIPGVQAETLKKLAAAGGGRYHPLTTANTDLDYLLPTDGAQALESEQDEQQTTEQWLDQGPWLLLLVLPAAALVFRRGYLVLAIFLVLPVPRNVLAAESIEPASFWLTPDQEATKAFEQNKFDEAAKQFENPEWRGTAQYRAGNYQQAVESFSGIPSSDAQFNKGNALFQLNQLEEAIKAYDEALQLDPGNEDAKINREIAEKRLKQEQQQQQNQQHQDQQDAENPEVQQREQEQQSQGSNNQNSDQQQSNSQQDSQDKNQSQQGEDSQQSGKPDEQTAGENNSTDPNSPQQQNPRPEKSGESAESTNDTDEPQAEETETHPSDEQTSSPEEEQQAASSGEPSQTQQENDQANKQWLERIPDDPGGLLRRKFLYQYQRQNRTQRNEPEAW